MKTKQFEPVTFHYNKALLPFFEAGKKEFQESGIELYGIEWEVVGNILNVTITIEQAERHLFSLAFKIGKAYGQSNKQ